MHLVHVLGYLLILFQIVKKMLADNGPQLM